MPSSRAAPLASPLPAAATAAAATAEAAAPPAPCAPAPLHVPVALPRHGASAHFYAISTLSGSQWTHAPRGKLSSKEPNPENPSLFLPPRLAPNHPRPQRPRQHLKYPRLQRPKQHLKLQQQLNQLLPHHPHLHLPNQQAPLFLPMSQVPHPVPRLNLLAQEQARQEIIQILSTILTIR